VRELLYCDVVTCAAHGLTASAKVEAARRALRFMERSGTV
jgi:hypothetical protein